MEPLSIRELIWANYLYSFAGVEIPKFEDKTTPEYKPKFDQLVRAKSAILIFILVLKTCLLLPPFPPSLS
jgi:hypothetical protein